MSLRAIQEGLSLVEVPILTASGWGQSKLSVVRDGLRYTQSICGRRWAITRCGY